MLRVLRHSIAKPQRSLQYNLCRWNQVRFSSTAANPLDAALDQALPNVAEHELETTFQSLGILGLNEIQSGLSIKLENGQEVFDQRSSANPTFTRRVLKYTGIVPKTTLALQGTTSVSPTTKAADSQTVYELQTVYDQGDPLNPDKIVFSKALRIVEPDAPSVVSLSSVSGMLAASAFCNMLPQNILMFGNAANTLPGYFFSITPSMSIDIVDPCTASQNIATNILPLNLPETCPPAEVVLEHPSHPLNIALRDGELEAAVHAFNGAHGSLGLRYFHHSVTPSSFFEDLVLDPSVDIESEEAKQLPEQLLASAVMAPRQYNMVFQDIDADPSYSTPEFIKSVVNILDSNGVYVRRMTIPTGCVTPDAVTDAARMDFESPDVVAKQMRSNFRAVYWSQPAIDTIILVGVKATFIGGKRSHPISEEALVDNAVAMWEEKAMTLEVLEKSDSFKYLYSDDNIDSMIINDPNYFDDTQSIE